ncbi:uncharacterized protein LOC127254989 [Andrographis paniculata]|uniref:uncharacterized protein LOC127254989 n=1 Tax=Andrographis paniculata TaxID=175694 RepID=UPI0021E7E5E0|nr:uncharacterized protein LOC127254989 [Andrographis paniculata]
MGMACCVSPGSLSSTQPSDHLRNDDTLTQSSVMSTYRIHIAGHWHNVTVLWSKNIMAYSLSMYIESMKNNWVYTCKIALRSWNFWGKKGYKRFEVDENPLDVYWDFRSAKLTTSPEPTSDFYVALVSKEEIVLYLGDDNKKAYKRSKARPSLLEAVMVCKKEHVYGKKSFSTRAKLDQRRECDIFVECSTTGPGDPEMWIRVDGVVLIHIVNLQWKFRGNQTVVVDKQPVQVFWDVHAWLFCSPGSDHGLFIFKTGVQEPDRDEAEDETRSDDGESKYYSVQSSSMASQFCLFLYAWKTEG